MIKEQFLRLEHTSPKVSAAFQVFLGSLLMAILAQISIPLQPIPMSLQTLGVFMLPVFLGKKRAAYSLLLYLGEATLGLPVLASLKMNPFWIMGPTAGYLLGFPVAAYVIGFLLEKDQNRSWLFTAVSLFVGQVTIYTFGVTFLSFMIGFEKAFFVGVLPFIPVNFYKLGIALLGTKFCDHK